MEKAVVILSGGMDSTTLLYRVLSQGYKVHALSFNYGQRHRKELEYAARTCKHLAVTHILVDLSAMNILLQGSALTSNSVVVPEGHYTEPSMKATVVPNRNMIMLSIATGYAVSIGAHEVFFAAHAGDFTVYPDCRKEFVNKLTAVTRIANYEPVFIRAPFLDMDKGDIAILGKQLGVDFSLTWSCYKGEERPCGKCGTCVERTEAFKKAGMPDPLMRMVPT